MIQSDGRIDVRYNNASKPKFAPFAQMGGEDYRFTMQNELDLVCHACQAPWPQLAKIGGAIVNIGSFTGIQGARALPQAAHAAAKGVVIALTRQLTAEGVAVGVRVNCASPVVMAIPPVLVMFEQCGENAPVAPVLKRTIDGKPGDPLAVTYAGLHRASDETKWVTGSHHVADDGAHAVM